MTGRWPRFLIDHENNTKTDNRWRNLRSSNKTKNAQNGKRHKDNKCGFKGVWKLSDKPRPKPYAASIRVDGKTIWLGTYKRAKEAHQAYVKAAKEHFKEFARTA
jgi:hypothetical protein